MNDRKPSVSASEIEKLTAMEDDLYEGAEMLSYANVDVIGYGCTSGTFVRGIEYDKKLIETIKKKTGIRATTTSSSVLKALEEMEITKIAIATPYVHEVVARCRIFFEKSGFEVVDIKGLGSLATYENGDLVTYKLAKAVPSVAYRLAKDVDKLEADGILISCTDMRAIEIIDMLEEDTGKPVVTSNQALLWNMLRMAGLRKSIMGYGKLLRKT
jgi:maleate isomerase